MKNDSKVRGQHFTINPKTKGNEVDWHGRHLRTYDDLAEVLGECGSEDDVLQFSKVFIGAGNHINVLRFVVSYYSLDRTFTDPVFTTLAELQALADEADQFNG